tara:strand:+ start:82 stop:210 length:129 start_codon:yes stop_codon:yes gene_type:complete
MDKKFDGVVSILMLDYCFLVTAAYQGFIAALTIRDVDGYIIY